MVEFVELIASKRRFLIVGLIILADLFLMTLLASAAHSHHVSAEVPNAEISSSQPAHSYDGPNVITDGFLMLNDNIGHFIGSINENIYRSFDSVAVGASNINKSVIHGANFAVVSSIHGIVESGRFIIFDIFGGVFGLGRAVVTGTTDGLVGIGRSIVGSMTFVGHDVFVGSMTAVGRGIAGYVSYEMHGTESIRRNLSPATYVSSIIRPVDNTPTPTITELRMRQATLIQTGTRKVIIAPVPHGVGGACDSGDGNGGYPMAWCNSPMDSVATIGYSNDPINRECTSYAFWYFRHIEGHGDFHVTGNAKDWGVTSNYPTRSTPAVGAIAVESGGAYGHVAIVQALPGQVYAGRTTPAGYVLLSEMNYDWNGHFRYSYSPLGKFSAFIWP